MLKSLNVAQSGLSAAKIAVENASNNIANENTPGYKKRVVQLSELSISDSRFTGRGVRADESYRITSEYMFNNIMRESTKNSYYDEVSNIIGNVEQMFQETDSSGFSHDLDRFLQAIENLRSNPNSEVYKASLKGEGKVLVESLQGLYTDIEQQEKITYNRLEDNVTEINSILHDIGELNERMGEQNASANDLLDKRDELEKKLSSLVDIEVDRTDGDYQLKIGGEVAVRYNTNIREVNLVEENTAQLDRFATEDSNGFAIDSIKDSYSLDTDDVITYKFNNEHEVSVKIGDYVQDASGNNVDITGDGVVDANDIVDDTNFIRGLVYKINHDANISDKVDAYNGNYDIDANGNKIDSTSADEYLVIESKTDGTDGTFDGRISVTKMTGATVDNRSTLFKDDYQSVEANDKVYLAVYDSEITVKSGTVKAQIENLSSDSANNKLADYKEKLDALAKTLSDIYDKYVSIDDENYVYGDIAADSYNGSENINDLGLFSGGDVKSLKFNEDSIDNLTQADLNYLSEMQWKKDIDFDGFAQDASTSNKTSFAEFYQELRVSISSNKEDNDFLMETQTAVVQSLENSYDQLTKVDSDEEMVNLIQFQAAYTANAKIITIVDEMIDTLLGIR